MSRDRRTGTSGADDEGFTLVEVLAAVALLSLLSLMLLGAIRLGLKAWERAETHAERVDDIMATQAFLRRLIEEAYPHFRAPDPAAPGHVAFEGTAEGLSLVASAPRALGSGRRARISLSAERRGARLALIVAATPELTSGGSLGARKVLLANVQSVELSYFGKGRSDQAAAWRERWTDEATLPQLVRVRVGFSAGDGRVWPELVVAPRIVADVGCVYDPLTSQCRGRPAP